MTAQDSHTAIQQDDVTITFGESAAETVLEAFGWHVTNTGYIWDDDAVLSITGEPVHIDELAGIVQYEGEPRPIRDDFPELVEYAKYTHETEVSV